MTNAGAPGVLATDALITNGGELSVLSDETMQAFDELLPARFVAPGQNLPQRPKLTKLPLAFGQAMENTPVIWRSRPLLVLNRRDDTKNKTDGYTRSMYLYIQDLANKLSVQTQLDDVHHFALQDQRKLLDVRRVHQLALFGGKLCRGEFVGRPS